jgi:hypothetical protein
MKTYDKIKKIEIKENDGLCRLTARHSCPGGWDVWDGEELIAEGLLTQEIYPVAMRHFADIMGDIWRQEQADIMAAYSDWKRIEKEEAYSEGRQSGAGKGWKND